MKVLSKWRNVATLPWGAVILFEKARSGAHVFRINHACVRIVKRGTEADMLQPRIEHTISSKNNIKIEKAELYTVITCLPAAGEVIFLSTPEGTGFALETLLVCCGRKWKMIPRGESFKNMNGWEVQYGYLQDGMQRGFALHVKLDFHHYAGFYEGQWREDLHLDALRLIPRDKMALLECFGGTRSLANLFNAGCRTVRERLRELADEKRELEETNEQAFAYVAEELWKLRRISRSEEFAKLRRRIEVNVLGKKRVEDKKSPDYGRLIDKEEEFAVAVANIGDDPPDM